MDTVPAERCSEIMGLVRGKDTGPELRVRRLIYALGYRYRLHVSSLPGRPDLVFSARKKVVFVHGCFWHRHEHCPNARIPKSNRDFWLKKFSDNVQRDAMHLKALKSKGWATLIIWGCELADEQILLRKVRSFLDA